MNKKNTTEKSTSKSKTIAKRNTSKKQISQNESDKGKPWTFPKNTLEDAINIAKAIEEKNAGNPMHSSDLVKAAGFQQSKDWRYLDLLRSANLYGLVSGTGSAANITLEKLGQDIVAPSSPKQRKDALLDAFRKVDEFKKVSDFYGQKRIPEDEFFYNTLTREFGIPRDRVEKFSEVFVSNLKFLNSFQATSHEIVETTNEKSQVESSSEIPKISPKSETRVREFLDICFVMMPFGDWNDRYYQEIYVLAIKDAGFEPSRADELFTSGSVVEQIWEQIKKSKVLVADLTGKNPNVFYELGLAHAATKPVIFVASSIEDIPYDLRHLRVIIYDNREPEWAAKLRNQITDYLKNAIKEPEKSIPHPFRLIEDNESFSNK